jgi:hypothetical protein
MARKGDLTGDLVEAGARIFVLVYVIALVAVAFLAFTGADAVSGFSVAKSFQSFWKNLIGGFGGASSSDEGSNNTLNNADPSLVELVGRVTNGDPTLDIDQAGDIVDQYYAEQAGIPQSAFQGGGQ